MAAVAPELQTAISALPAGAWAVGVSGGADSVALLSLLHTRSDLSLHVVHLDHQTRGHESAGDAAFVQNLAQSLAISCTIARLSEVEPRLVDPPPNISARYRAARFQLFRDAVTDHHLSGVVLAHHRDDQVETIFQRLLRGSSYVGLCGMCQDTIISNLRIFRPLLKVGRDALRQHLRSIGQAWREDASNASDQYGRNRVRRWLAEHSGVGERMLKLGQACTSLRDCVQTAAPALPAQWPMHEIAKVPPVLAEMAVRQWLVASGVPHEQIDPSTLDRVLSMATDAATPAKMQVSKSIVVRRRARMIFAEVVSSAG